MNGKASLYTSVLWVGFLTLAAAGAAQDDTYDSGYIRFVDGSVSLQRAHNPEPEQGSINLPVLPGDRMWTTASSFAEVRFVDGTLVRLGEETKVDFMAFGAEPNLRLWNGSIVVKVSAESSRVRIDTPSGSVYQQTPGTYRIDVVDGATTTVSVREGVAELASEQSSVLVATGQRATLEAGGPPQEPVVFDLARADALDAWSREHDREEPRRRSVPLAEAHYYTEELDDYGTWRENEDYGSVWYPTGGGASWAPYRDGRWSYTSYGYTWVSHEPWGWAPYHYGRWGYNHYGWYWVPGRRFSPAWVSFAVGPAWIGWSPLGYHGRSVFAYNHGFYGGGRYPHYKGRPYYRGGKAVPRQVYDHGAGWNFSNKEQFGRRGKARLRASDVRSTSARARVHHQGTVLDRNMTARARNSDTFAPRGPRANPFTTRAGVSTTRAPRRSGSQRSLTRTSTAQRARQRRPDTFTTQAPTPRTRARATRTSRAGSRVFRAPSQPRTTTSRGRSPERSSTAGRRTTSTRSRVIQTTPSRTSNRTRVRSRARTFGAAPSTSNSTRRETTQRSPSRARQRSTTPTRVSPTRNRVRAPNRNRATPSTQRIVRTPTRNRAGVARTAPRSQKSSTSRSRSRVTRSGSRTQPRSASSASSASSGRVSRSRGRSRQSSGRSGAGRGRGGARRRN